MKKGRDHTTSLAATPVGTMTETRATRAFHDCSKRIAFPATHNALAAGLVKFSNLSGTAALPNHTPADMGADAAVCSHGAGNSAASPQTMAAGGPLASVLDANK